MLYYTALPNGELSSNVFQLVIPHPGTTRKYYWSSFVMIIMKLCLNLCHQDLAYRFKGRLQWKNQLRVFCTTLFVYPCNAQKTFLYVFIAIIDWVIKVWSMHYVINLKLMTSERVPLFGLIHCVRWQKVIAWEINRRRISSLSFSLGMSDAYDEIEVLPYQFEPESFPSSSPDESHTCILSDADEGSVMWWNIVNGTRNLVLKFEMKFEI